MRRRSLLLALALLAACSRSALHDGPPAGRAGGGAGAGPPDREPPPCFLAPAGPTLPFLAFPEGDTGAPGFAALDPGDAAAGREARVAYQAISEDANFWHPELRVAGLRILASWSDGVVIEQGPTLLGFDAHAWGEIAPRAGAGEGVALAWFRGDEAAGKPSGLKFRTLDASTWTAGAEVFVDPAGSVVHGLAPGAGVGPNGHEGDGYALAYRAVFEDGSAEPRVALLDPAGNLIAGPLPIAGPTPYPGRSTDIAWTGAIYLMAAGFDACGPADPACAPGAMVVSRLRLDAGGAVAPEITAALPVLEPGSAPRRPYLAAGGEGAYLAWTEGDPTDDAAPRVVRLAILDAGGALAGEPVTLAEGVRVAASLAITEAPPPGGVIVAWGEDAEPERMPHEVGYGQLVVHQRGPDGAPVGEPIAIATTAFSYSAFPAAVSLAHPRGVLLTWAASAESPDGPSQTFLARLDCHERR